MIPPVPSTVPAGLTTGALPKTGMEDPLLLLQYQQMVLHNQLLVRQARTSAIAKLSQSEHWATLSPVEQNQLIQYVIQDGMPEIPEVPIATNPFVPHIVSQPTNPVIQLFTQMQVIHYYYVFTFRTCKRFSLHWDDWVYCTGEDAT